MDFQFELVEKSGNPYLGYWYFNIKNITLYDENDNFLGSKILSGGELSNYQIEDKFTGSLHTLPIETAKIVIN